MATAGACSRPSNEASRTVRRTEPTAVQAADEPPPAPSDTPSAPLASAADMDPPPGNAPPDATLSIATAAAIRERVRALGGKGTLVNAWASWCGPCRRELPMLARLAPKLAASGIHVLFVSVDEPEDREKALSFLRANSISQPSYLAARPLDAFKAGMNPRWPGMLPASFLYDSTGKLRYYWGGEVFEQELVPTLTAFAAGTLVDGEANFAVSGEAANR